MIWPLRILAQLALTLLGVGLQLLLAWQIWSPEPGWLLREPIGVTALMALEVHLAGRAMRGVLAL